MSRPARSRSGRRPATKASPSAAVPAPHGDWPIPGTERRHPGLGLGLWALGRWTSEDEARTKATAARALELGVRWFDTAEVYGAGRSERLLGDLLARGASGGSEAFVVTKVSWEHLRPTQIRAALINSLERLGRRSVDLYLVHAPDPKVPLQETMPVLESLWKEGRIGAIGVSNFSVEQLEEAERHLSEARLAAHQVRMNLLDSEEAESVLPFCRQRKIVIEAYTPLALGILAGRYLDGRRSSVELRRYAVDSFGESRVPELLARARRLRELAVEEKVPLASLALRWLESKGAAPLFGASRPPQVEEILRAWAFRVPAAALRRAEEIGRGDRA